MRKNRRIDFVYYHKIMLLQSQQKQTVFTNNPKSRS